MSSVATPELEYTTTATGAKQVLCPPDVPEYSSVWLSDREQYLFSKGWEKENIQAGLPTYRDPKGSNLKGELRDAVTLPVKGDDLNKTMVVQQIHLPPANYSFTIEEALDIQRRRDAVGDDGPSPLDRLGACEQKCNKLELQLEQTRARIRVLLSAHPITLDGLRLGLRELIGA